MAREVDYIAPMVYPSHWGPCEYDVADPNGQPYEIVLASTAGLRAAVRGTGARVVKWLQDFSYGLDYSSAEVRAQIRASRDAGVNKFILWDAAVKYTADALAATAEIPALAHATSPRRTRRGRSGCPTGKPCRGRRPSGVRGETRESAAARPAANEFGTSRW